MVRLSDIKLHMRNEYLYDSGTIGSGGGGSGGGEHTGSRKLSLSEQLVQ